MGNRIRLRPGQLAAQDQALAEARAAVARYGAVISVHATGGGVCTYLDAADTACFGATRYAG